MKRRISHELHDLMEVESGMEVATAGLITSVNRRFTKNAQAMANFTVEDGLVSMRCTIFPRDYERMQDMLFVGRSVVLRGKVKNTSGTPELTVTEIIAPCKLYLRLPSSQSTHLITQTQEILRHTPGTVRVEAYYEDVKLYVTFPGISGVELDKNMLTELEAVLGKANVVAR